MAEKSAILIRLTVQQREWIDSRTIGWSVAGFVRQAVDYYQESFARKEAEIAEAGRLRIERRAKRPRKLVLTGHR